MKIVLFNSLYYPYIAGGAEIIFKEQVEGLKARGFDVFVITIHGGDVIKEEKVNGIRVFRIPCFNIYWAYDNKKKSNIKKLRWHLKDIYNIDVKKSVETILEREKPNIAICHNLCGLSVSVWDAIKSHGVPIIQVIHDQYMICINSNSYRKGHYCEDPCISCKAFRLLAKKKSQNINAVIGVSQYVLDRFLDLGYYSNASKYVIHNARLFPVVQKRYWDGIEPLHIGYIGNVSKVKGVDLLVRAFVNSRLNATLTIAGKANEESFLDELKTYSVNDKDIKFSGFVNSQEFYKQVNLIVIPSVWPDTFPTVAFEACANNVPVICSRIGGLPEIIHSGKNGLLFEPGNERELASIFDSINPKQYNEWVNNARKEVAEMLDSNSMFEKLIHIINKTYVWGT